MLKNMTIKRISLASILLFICALFLLFPSTEKEKGLNIKEDIEYVDNNVKTHEIYLVNKDNYVARTNVIVNEEETIKKVKTMLEYLIMGGKKESNIPNGFRGIIPSGTEVLSVDIKDEEVLINGKKEIRSMCEFGINLDERIADGYYFAKSVKYLEYVFNNPKLLEDTIDTKIEIEEIR